MKILLASRSPRRRSLLSITGWPFRSLNPDVVENQKRGEGPRPMVLRLARLKAQWAVGRERRDEIILGADTLIVVNSKILGKPKNQKDQCAMLRKLSGKTHRVFTGLALYDNGIWTQKAECSRVSFRSLKDKEIMAYCKHREALDCAGGYMIQGLGAALVDTVEGSLTNVIGLPLELLERLLKISAKIAP